MGPHPAVASVRLAVREALRRHATPDQPVLVACSGGADSLALAAAVAFEAAHSGRRAGMITVDHGLQDGSAARARAVVGLGFELGLDPVLSIAVEVGNAGGPEAAAREARYAALIQSAGLFGEAEALIALGHTADDQAETVLLGLGRGSGVSSLAGMRERSGPYLRPFLGLGRAQTVAACAALGLPVWDDPHNLDPRFRRTRVRHEALPLLEDVLGGGVAAALARTAGQLAEADDALQQWAERLRADSAGADGSLSAHSLVDSPRAVRARVLKKWAEAQGVPSLASVHVAGLEALVTDWRGQGPIDLPGGYRACRRSGTLRVLAPQASAAAPDQPTFQE